MRQLKRLVAWVAVALAPAAMQPVGSGTAVADGPTSSASQGAMVPLSAILRRCDHSDSTYVPGAGVGQAYAIIGRAGSTVTAEVHLHSRLPDLHYNVRLIEVPRSSAALCGPGAPGTGYGSFDTDWAGNGSTTVEAPVAPGATGAWVFLEGPDGGNTKLVTGEFYTSDYVAAI